MKRAIFASLIVIILFVAGFLGGIFYSKKIKSPNLITNVVVQRPLDKYTIENLSNTTVEAGTLEGGMKLSEADKYISYLINFNFKPDFKNNKNISTLMNIPNGQGPFPIVIMIRGYIDQKTYQSGDGTRNVAKYFAENGFITIAPDFLGYGDSDSEAGNIFEARFQTYTTVLALIKTINENFTFAWDHKNIFIWSHSNGGQIVLTTLEASGVNYPTVLWAPVSKPFPYSVLYYTDESEDKGRLIRSALAKFESLYDVELYSFDNYLNDINAPLQIEQGTADDAVPLSWSKDLLAKLKNLDKDVTLYTYQGADHNLQPAWNTVVEADLKFYKAHLQ
jgi:alpha-beta hydrolase superfamily lysophospholipase